MNTTKILSSVCAFLLVLSAGGCHENGTPSSEEELFLESCDSSEDIGEGNYSDETTSDDYTDVVEPFTGGWNNFTISFTFCDNYGNNVSLPTNTAAYIIGGWDNWNEYLPLVQDGKSYYYTFNHLDIATYRYKVVMWFSDEEVSWLNCVEITDGNQILRVRSDYYDNYICEINLTLNVSLPTDEERENRINSLSITMEILNAASKIDSVTSLWDAIHIETETHENKASYNVCLKSDNQKYGDYWCIDEYERYFIYGVGSYEEYQYDTHDYYYFKDGLCYDYFTSTKTQRESPSVTVDLIEYNSFDDLAADYFMVFLNSESLINLIQTGIDLNGNVTSSSLSTSANNYILEVNSESNGLYTYICNSEFEFTYASFDDFNGYSFEIEPTTIGEIETKINLLRSSFDFCIEPTDVFKRTYANCNYAIQYEITRMVSNDYIAYEEYSKATDDELNSIADSLKTNYELYESTIYICYTEEALFIRKGYMIDDDTIIYSSPRRAPRFLSDYGILLVNSKTKEGDDCLYVYFSDDYGDSWQLGSFTDYAGVVHTSDQPVYEGHWQDYCYSLANCYGIVTEGDFYFESITSRYPFVGGFTDWSITNLDAMAYLFKCLGGQFQFGDSYNDFLSTYMNLCYFYYDPYYREIEIAYDYESFFPKEDFLEEGYEIYDETEMYVWYLGIVATIKDIGNVDINQTINEWTR